MSYFLFVCDLEGKVIPTGVTEKMLIWKGTGKIYIYIDIISRHFCPSPSPQVWCSLTLYPLIATHGRERVRSHAVHRVVPACYRISVMIIILLMKLTVSGRTIGEVSLHLVGTTRCIAIPDPFPLLSD